MGFGRFVLAIGGWWSHLLGGYDAWHVLLAASTTVLVMLWVARLARESLRERDRQAASGVRPTRFILFAITVISAALASADTAPSPGSEQPSSEPAPALQVHGFVDAVGTWNANRPADHASFFPGVGTAA